MAVGSEVSVVELVLISEAGDLGPSEDAVEVERGFRRADNCARVRPPLRDAAY